MYEAGTLPFVVMCYAKRGMGADIFDQIPQGYFPQTLHLLISEKNSVPVRKSYRIEINNEMLSVEPL